MRLNGERYLVAGVMPGWFAFPAGVDVWTPREEARNPFPLPDRQVVGRLRERVPLHGAAARRPRLPDA